jgi:hypothetical protein
MNIGAKPFLLRQVSPAFQAAHPTHRNSFKPEIQLGRRITPRKAIQCPVVGQFGLSSRPGMAGRQLDNLSTPRFFPRH